MEEAILRLKESDWQIPLFAVISSVVVLHDYDLSCMPANQKSLILSFLYVNLVGFFVSIGYLLKHLFKNENVIVTAVLLTFYILFNIASFVLIVLTMILLYKYDEEDACESEGVVVLYFRWIITAYLVSVFLYFFKKFHRREKFDKEEGLIIRGSHRGI